MPEKVSSTRKASSPSQLILSGLAQIGLGVLLPQFTRLWLRLHSSELVIQAATIAGVFIAAAGVTTIAVGGLMTWSSRNSVRR